jgi:hypothetical protein
MSAVNNASRFAEDKPLTCLFSVRQATLISVLGVVEIPGLTALSVPFVVKL